MIDPNLILDDPLFYFILTGKRKRNHYMKEKEAKNHSGDMETEEVSTGKVINHNDKICFCYNVI